MEEYRIKSVAFIHHEVLDYLDTMFSKNSSTLPRNLGIRISRTDDNLRKSVLDYRLGAWRGFAIMAAWLKSHIYGRTQGRLCERGESIPLGMKLAVFLMIALTNDSAILYNNGTNDRIRIGKAASALCKFDGSQHEISVSHNESPNKKP